MLQQLLSSTFHLWERAASSYLEALAQSPLLLATAGSWLGWSFNLKRLSDDGLQAVIAALGLPTRRDQERALHLLQEIEGRLEDLELRVLDRTG